MFGSRRDALFGLVAALALSSIPPQAVAEPDFPVRPVRLVVSFPPGGAADTTGRLLSNKLAERWKQPVVVDNRPGGNTVVSVQEVIKQKPDGYTLLLALDSTLVMNQHLFRVPKYDPLKDLSPVATVADFPLFLMTRNDSGAKSGKDYLRRAMEEKGQLKVGTSSFLTTIAAEVLNGPAEVKTIAVQYKGTADNTLGLLRGDIDFMVDVDATAASHVKAGKLVILATSGAKRVPTYPDVPTFGEVLGKDASMSAWFGLVGPTEMSEALMQKISGDVAWATQQPDVKAALQEKSLFPAPGTPEDLKRRIEVDARKYGEIIRRLNLSIE